MATKNTTAPRLEVKGIRKTFGQNAVLKGINLSVDAGEVVALIGGNGAGKSTLMKIIMGIYTCDEGDILIDGQAVKLGKPAASLAHGIYLVPQEPMLFPNMTVLENILMGFNENEGELKKRLDDCMKELNFDLNLQRKANTLSIAEQQLVELLRGMMRNAQILILDEPTSSLTFNEVQSLFKTVEDLKKKGIAIIYITHRLTEVFEIATHVAIMRDGVITLEGPVEELHQGNADSGSSAQRRAGRPADGKGVCAGGLCPSQARHAGEGFQRLRLQQHHVRPVSGRNPRHCGRRRRGPHGAHQHHLRPRQGARRQGHSGRAGISRVFPPRRFWRRASTSCRKTATTTAFSKSARFLPTRRPRC